MMKSAEFKCNPAAKQLWVTITDMEGVGIVKAKRSAIAALRRLLTGISTTSTNTDIVVVCPLIEPIMVQLCLKGISKEDQYDIANLWEWLIGLKG